MFNISKRVVYIVLFWAMALTTIIVLRVTNVAVITAIGSTGTTAIITALLGIIGGVISYYTYKRGSGTDSSPNAPQSDSESL